MNPTTEAAPLTERLTLIEQEIVRHRYHCTDESELQEAIAAVLHVAGIPFTREVRLSPADRIDFLIDDIGIELKVDGQSGSVHRQLARYAEHPDIAALLLVTTSVRIGRGIGAIGGKPVRVVRLLRGLG